MTGNTDLEVKFVPKQREMLQKFRVSLKISWEPGSLVPGEYHRYILFTMYWFFAPGGFFRYQSIPPNLAPEIRKIWLKT